MTDQIAPGAWWLSGTRGCNVFLLEADDGSFVLIDAAFASSAQAIVRETRAISGDRPVTHLVLTHAHPDHTGAAVAVAGSLGATIVAGEGDCVDSGGQRVLRAGGRRAPAPERALVRLRGRRRGNPKEPIPVDCAVGQAGEDIAPGITAHAVPGHTPGSLCVIGHRAGASFVGDLVIGHSDGLSRTLAATNENDELYRSEMGRFATITPDLGCPGHGYPTRNFATALAELAATPREPWAFRNTPGRIRRLLAFSRFMMMKRG